MYQLSEDYTSININGNSFAVSEYDNDSILLEPKYVEIQDTNFTVHDFPETLLIEIQVEDGFDTNLFYELSISKNINSVKLTFICLQPNKYWEGTWGLSTFLATLHDIITGLAGIEIEGFDIESDWKEIELSFSIDSDFILKNKIDDYVIIIKGLLKQTELLLSGAVWRKEFETEESLFCTDILYPLLRKMDFIDVHYTHGVKEYGKDFTFSEHTKFGNLRHYGLQAKAGNIRGNVNSDIDELIGQLDDAFSMPYHEVSSNESRRIATFIIAISGLFTDNAKEKIAHKVPKHFKGSVYFLDREKILELIERYWLRK